MRHQLASCAILLMSCGLPADISPPETSPQPAEEIVLGRVYVMPDGDGSFMVSKVLVIDDFAVHMRSYSEMFVGMPETIDTTALTVLIGHAPLSPDGFRDSEPTLVSTEPVREDELEGYRVYLEAVQQ